MHSHAWRSATASVRRDVGACQIPDRATALASDSYLGEGILRVAQDIDLEASFAERVLKATCGQAQHPALFALWLCASAQPGPIEPGAGARCTLARVPLACRPGSGSPGVLTIIARGSQAPRALESNCATQVSGRPDNGRAEPLQARAGNSGPQFLGRPSGRGFPAFVQSTSVSARYHGQFTQALRTALRAGPNKI